MKYWWQITLKTLKGSGRWVSQMDRQTCHLLAWITALPYQTLFSLSCADVSNLTFVLISFSGQQTDGLEDGWLFFVNKVLQTHGHCHSFPYFLWLISCSKSRVVTETYGHVKPKTHRKLGDPVIDVVSVGRNYLKYFKGLAL